MKSGFKKGLGFLFGCILIFGSPHLMYACMVVLHPTAVLANRARVISIFTLSGYPVPVLIGLYALFIGCVLVWKCHDADKFKTKK